VRRLCPVCCHPARAEIDSALIERQARYAELAARYGVGVDALKEHYTRHIRWQDLPPGDDRILDGGPDVANVADAIARDAMGAANWRHYVARWRRERRSRRDA